MPARVSNTRTDNRLQEELPKLLSLTSTSPFVVIQNPGSHRAEPGVLLSVRDNGCKKVAYQSSFNTKLKTRA